MKEILRCKKCKRYTLHKECKCGGEAVSPRPQKFSIHDPYAKYRREAKKEIYKEKGLI